MMYSVEYIMTVTNSMEIFHSYEKFDGITHVCYIWSDVTGDTLSVNIGVRNSVAFFTCDVFCPISHKLYELSRFFHSRVVYH